jgi:hypothetical protein
VSGWAADGDNDAETPVVVRTYRSALGPADGVSNLSGLGLVVGPSAISSVRCVGIAAEPVSLDVIGDPRLSVRDTAKLARGDVSLEAIGEARLSVRDEVSLARGDDASRRAAWVRTPTSTGSNRAGTVAGTGAAAPVAGCTGVRWTASRAIGRATTRGARPSRRGAVTSCSRACSVVADDPLDGSRCSLRAIVLGLGVATAGARSGVASAGVVVAAAPRGSG